MARGSKPGEHRGGRTKGIPNKATTEIKSIAQQYTAKGVEELAILGGLIEKEGRKASESDQVRVAAIKELFDRAHGRPSQAIVGEEGNPVRMAGEIKITIIDPKA